MSKKKLKIVFFGTPEFAVLILKALIRDNYNIVAVVTQPDKKTGRHQDIASSPAKNFAIAKGIDILQPDILNEKKTISKIKSFQADLFVVAAYGKILPKILLDMPKYGAINVHASLLPKYRGASPVQCAIRKDEKKTGVTLIRMNEKMDEGDILMTETVNIDEKITAEELSKKLAIVGSKLIAKFLPRWIAGKISPTVQCHKEATYCERTRRDDGRISSDASGKDILLAWRAYHPWPGIYAFFKIKGKLRRIKITQIDFLPKHNPSGMTGTIVKYKGLIALKVKDGIVMLKKLQMEGKKELLGEDFLRGYPEFIGCKIE